MDQSSSGSEVNTDKDTKSYFPSNTSLTSDHKYYSNSQIAKFMGPTWAPDEPHVGPLNIAIREGLNTVMINQRT